MAACQCLWVVMSQFERLIRIMARLRGEDGCPWDQQQTHASLRPYLIEETYEVIEALDGDDSRALCIELGDLLLQIVFHARIAEEDGRFDVEDVARAICDKLEHRHPHVFADTEVSSAAEVLVNWEQLKLQEDDNADRTSVLDGIPAGLPALQRATVAQKKASKVGFDWDDSNGPMAKIHEELAELQEAAESGDAEATRAELGDLLFAVCNLARFLTADSETALREAVRRFETRFRAMEQYAAEQGRSMHEMGIGELEQLWQRAKDQE